MLQLLLSISSETLFWLKCRPTKATFCNSWPFKGRFSAKCWTCSYASKKQRKMTIWWSLRDISSWSHAGIAASLIGLKKNVSADLCENLDSFQCLKSYPRLRKKLTRHLSRLSTRRKRRLMNRWTKLQLPLNNQELTQKARGWCQISKLSLQGAVHCKT